MHSMQCFMWQDNMVLMPKCGHMREAMRTVRPAGSGDELDMSAKLGG